MQDDHIYSLYVATSPDGRQYVGLTSKTVEHRWKTHDSYWRAAWPGDDKAAIGHAIGKFGRDSFTVEHVASAKGADAAMAVEAALIAQYRTMTPHGWNRREGGGYVPPHARNYLYRVTVRAA